MHSELFSIKKETADIINTAKNNGSKIFAVGTTTVRALEVIAKEAIPDNLREHDGYYAFIDIAKSALEEK